MIRPDIPAIQRRAQAADKAICAVAQDANKFQMCVPPQPDDTDTLIVGLTREDVPALIAYIEALEQRAAAPTDKTICINGQYSTTPEDELFGSMLLSIAQCGERWQLFYRPRGQQHDVRVLPDDLIPIYDGMKFRRILVDITGG